MSLCGDRPCGLGRELGAGLAKGTSTPLPSCASHLTPMPPSLAVSPQLPAPLGRAAVYPGPSCKPLLSFSPPRSEPPGPDWKTEQEGGVAPWRWKLLISLIIQDLSVS